jgi:primosomal protein N' (replication factor Y)
LTFKQRHILSVAVTLPVRGEYTYSVPDELVPPAAVAVGCRIMVPFRNRKVIGYVLKKEIGEKGEGIKDIQDVLDSEPLFHDNLVPFFQWMADYYLFPIGLLIQSALPSGLNVAPGRSGIGPLKRKFVRFKEGIDFDSLLSEQAGELKAKNEHEFLKVLSLSEGISLQEIYARFSNGPYLVRKWTKSGLIEPYSASVFRDSSGKILVPSPEPSSLYNQQEDALKQIKRQLAKGAYATFLLNGVTGSGKTEVYYNAVKHALELGRQALLMVPEIALSIYMEGIFRSRLGDRVAMFHSGLSRGERYDQWIRMLRGEVDLVIGARSTLFAPLPRIGLIIVDEEYDSSFKQEEGPRHHARDAAVVRGRMEKALVLLGSGTPSVQSFHNALTGRYKLLSMPERIENRPLPDIEIVDMKNVSEGKESDQILSPVLKEALEQNLAEGSQAILFLNRRGFGRVYLCRSCGESVRCPNCDLTLTFHLKDNNLACHFCGFSSRPQEICPSCGHVGMRPYGFGTERLEKALGEKLPKARVARLDRDSARRKGQIFSILKKFSENEIDILVGTQMITKGYDFPNVTLVGVISADLSLGFPDFRAGERTFQLLSQVAGRAGRGEKSGRVIIQTFNPGHYAIMAAKNHDYDLFFQREKELREQLGYPPFSYLACLRFQGNEKKLTEESAKKIGMETRAILSRWPSRGKEIEVLGPAEAPLAKLKGKYRWQILIKGKKTEILHYLLKEVEGLSGRILRKNRVSMIIDMDPYQML